jgi:hypothetical protein
MSQARMTDSLNRLDTHHTLHLPLRKRDLLGRLALRFLWRRQLKWQLETNLAVRDAARAMADEQQAQRALIDELSARPVVSPDLLNHELAALHRADQNTVAGLSQRLHSAVGRVQTEITELRLELTEQAESATGVEDRLKAIEERTAELVSAERDVRLRHARFDLLLDELRAAGPVRTGADRLAAMPDRDAFLELAACALLDGPPERVREARAGYLPVVREARDGGANGPVLDLAPGRGEWWEVLRAAGVPYRAASMNPLVRRHCTGIGCAVEDADPLELLAGVAHRSLGAVTAFRYLERLSPGDLARFADLASEALAPGGVLVVETPQPSEDFYLDPFARRPVHPDFLRFLLDAAGFSHVRVSAGYRVLAWR